MLHLPGLVLSEQINQIQAVNKLGLAVRGLYEAPGAGQRLQFPTR